MLRWRFWGGRRIHLILVLVGLFALAGGLSGIALHLRAIKPQAPVASPDPSKPVAVSPQTAPPQPTPPNAWTPADPTPLMASYSRPEPKVRTAYQLAVQLDPTAMQLKGQAHVTVTNNEEKALTQLVFHLYPNAPFFHANGKGALSHPGSLTVQSVQGGGKGLSFDGAATEILTVNLPQPLAPGAAITLDLTYQAAIPSQEGRFGTDGRNIYLGQAYPILAVHDSGGWHVDRYVDNGDPFYADVSDYDVTLSVPAGYQVAATGHLQESPSDGSYHFRAERAREFGAAASASWSLHETSVDGVAIHYFQDTKSTTDADVAGALAAITGSLHLFNQQFGAYPYQDLTVIDHIGMEYPGFVMAGPDPHVIAHEVAHQWWYAVVGNDELRQIWDEGLTEFSALLYTAQSGAPAPASSYLAAGWTGRMDESLYALAADRNSAQYPQVIYRRGWRLWEALRTQMGDEAFFRLLRDFYKAHQFGNATWADWRAAVLGAGGSDAVAVFDQYVAGEKGTATPPEGVAAVKP